MLFHLPVATFIFIQSIVLSSITWLLTGNLLFTWLAFSSGIFLFVAWIFGSWISGVLDDKAYKRETVNSDAKLAQYGLSLEKDKSMVSSEDTLFHTKLKIRDWLLSNEGSTTEQLQELFPIKDFTGTDYEDILTVIGAYGFCRFGQDSKGMWHSMQNAEAASNVYRIQRENQKKYKLVTV